MTAPQDFLVANGFFGLGKETTWDTPVVPGFWIPMQSPKWNPDEKWLMDESIVGSPVVTRDAVPGVRKDTFDLKHYVYPDSIGNFLVALLGGTDTVSGTGPFIHTVKLLNNAATASQPPSYTLDYFDSSQTRQIAGARIASTGLTWSADGTIECTSKFIGMPETDVSLPTQTLSQAHFVPGWGVSLSLAGTPLVTLVSGSLDITRVGTDAIFTATNQQGPHNIFSGPIQVKGKAKCLVETGAANFFTTALARNQQVGVLTLTEPVSAATLALTMSAMQFMKPVLDDSKKWLMVDVDFEAIADPTDATTGISPLQAVLTNSQSTAY